MYLLRIIIIFFITVFVFSCKAEGPLSPEESFNSLKTALKSDAGNIERLLSERSKRKVEKIIHMISQMNNAQLKALGERFGMDAARLKNLSVKDFLFIQYIISNTSNSGIFKEIETNSILGTDINDKQATVRLDNGMELSFVKEGRYWKFDMEELSMGIKE